MTRSTAFLSRWIYILAASLYFLAVLLRSWLVSGSMATYPLILGLLLAWLLLAVSESAITRRWAAYFPIYLVIQTILTFLMVTLPGASDFYAALLSVLAMQAMLRLNPRIAAGWIGLCALLMILAWREQYGLGQAVALALVFTAGSVFAGSYTLMMRRAEAARQRNQDLAAELDAANRQLQSYSAQLEQLAAARERGRLARDLHDSVTQTVFSMTLTAQSALLLLERSPQQVSAQLDRLYNLARSAMAELQVLIAELKPLAPRGLEAELRAYLSDSRFTSGDISISLEVEGDGQLSAAEVESLFHIAQEALNNILKHSGATQAQVRLHLAEPYWIEIADQGRGFDPAQTLPESRLGLAGMRERAAEIGWSLHVESAPGLGSRIRVSK